jgi:predicted nucleic acid-binding protein
MLVVDASVAVKWFVPEEGSDKAMALLQSQESLAAPSLIFAEVTRAFQKKHAAGLMTFQAIVEGVTDLRRYLHHTVALESLIGDALMIDRDHPHPIFDYLYLACAMRERCRVVTSDQSFIAKLSGTAFSDHVVHLGDWLPS